MRDSADIPIANREAAMKRSDRTIKRSAAKSSVSRSTIRNAVKKVSAKESWVTGSFRVISSNRSVAKKSGSRSAKKAAKGAAKRRSGFAPLSHDQVIVFVNQPSVIRGSKRSRKRFLGAATD